MSITVLLADDSEIMREAVRSVLGPHREIRLVGEAQTCREALRLAKLLRPEVVLLDIHMSDSKLIQDDAIRSACAGCRILVMSILLSGEAAQFASRIGAEAVLNKANLFDELVSAIRHSP